jgi:hypothetical protein
MRATRRFQGKNFLGTNGNIFHKTGQSLDKPSGIMSVCLLIHHVTFIPNNLNPAKVGILIAFYNLADQYFFH